MDPQGASRAEIHNAVVNLCDVSEGILLQVYDKGLEDYHNIQDNMLIKTNSKAQVVEPVTTLPVTFTGLCR